MASKTNQTSGWNVVRAKDAKTGDHYTTTQALAEQAGDEILTDHDAVDTYGNWLPRKENISNKTTTKTTKKEA